MARLIPAVLPDDGAGVSAAERVLFKEFGRQLGPEWTVLHSVHWLARAGGRARVGQSPRQDTAFTPKWYGRSDQERRDPWAVSLTAERDHNGADPGG